MANSPVILWTRQTLTRSEWVYVLGGLFYRREFSFPGFGIKSPSKILRRVAYPVEPFGFKFVSNRQPPPLLDGIRDRLGKKPSPTDNGQANELQRVHKAVSPVPWSVWDNGQPALISTIAW